MVCICIWLQVTQNPNSSSSKTGIISQEKAEARRSRPGAIPRHTIYSNTSFIIFPLGLSSVSALLREGLRGHKAAAVQVSVLRLNLPRLPEEDRPFPGSLPRGFPSGAELGHVAIPKPITGKGGRTTRTGSAQSRLGLWVGPWPVLCVGESAPEQNEASFQKSKGEKQRFSGKPPAEKTAGSKAHVRGWVKGLFSLT